MKSHSEIWGFRVGEDTCCGILDYYIIYSGNLKELSML
jgi:hypothetical protein